MYVIGESAGRLVGPESKEGGLCAPQNPLAAAAILGERMEEADSVLCAPAC